MTQKAEKQEAPEKEKKGPNKGLLPVLLLLLLAVAGVAAYLLTRPAPGPGTGLAYEENVVVGTLTETPEERQARLDGKVEEGMLVVSINGTPCTASDGSGDVNWNIENLNEGKLIRVEVTREDTGGLIFSTGAIRPDNSLPVGRLDAADMAPGEYACVAMFYGYLEESEKFVGRGGTRITLTVT